MGALRVDSEICIVVKTPTVGNLMINIAYSYINLFSDSYYYFRDRISNSIKYELKVQEHFLI